MATRDHWRKSSYSGGGEGNACVEISISPARVAIRDSKAPASAATLTLPPSTFTSFINALKNQS
ncbi:DUF397 domain-containing protein [Streptomyces alanosinicus]|uniref:DUF397 domain-containing protein n=1 Tax=Streptomyces alanosinicus TaxID=68171 RepID=A0A918YHX7_9ACTN|nr:DUF397 domain-containing protein [Streptomyces alanosinicus]GHE04483.1 hypothetical protein GCM10010339_36210 [Streptomyces alanosinicus]